MREFLTSRRARITPEQAGLRTYGVGARRVPGLRREEVALLAGVSVDYYTRLERGNASGVSDTVLEALARALQLDDTERAHLFDLARATQLSAPRKSRRSPQRIRPGGAAACSMRWQACPRSSATADSTSSGRTGSAARSTRSTSTAWPSRRTPRGSCSSTIAPRPSTSTGIASRPTWSRCSAQKRAVTRTTASSRTSSVSSRRGASCSGRSGRRTTSTRHDTGVKRFHHPLVGDLSLTFETMELVADPGLTMFVYTAEPGSKSEQALNLLASWTATPDEETTHADHEEQRRHRSGT